MARAIALRRDFSATELRRLARRSKDVGPARRLLPLAAIHDGGTRSAIHGVVRWRLCDLGQWLWEELRARSARSWWT